MVFGVSIVRLHPGAVLAGFVFALARPISMWCLLDKRYLASGIGMGGRWVEG